jgi:hypothetical protein
MVKASPAAHDATGRPIGVGDVVGGTTSGRYQTTIVGPIVSIGKSQVRVRVTNRAAPGSLRASNGDEVLISTDRVFLIAATTDTAGARDAGTQAEGAAGERQGLAGRITHMADYWERELPEVIRTGAVVSALRTAVETFR